MSTDAIIYLVGAIAMDIRYDYREHVGRRLNNIVDLCKELKTKPNLG